MSIGSSSEPRSHTFSVTETFFSVDVRDMERASKFYSAALGATVTWASPVWSSLSVAGVRVGLFTNPNHPGARVGLHFAVTDLDAASASVERAGGRIVTAAMQVAPKVSIVDVSDTEGNVFVLRGEQ